METASPVILAVLDTEDMTIIAMSSFYTDHTPEELITIAALTAPEGVAIVVIPCNV